MVQRRICNTVEAKAKLSELLNAVAGGTEIIIQRRGQPIAKLSSAAKETLDDRQATKRFLERLRRFHDRVRKAHGPRSDTVKLLRELRKESS
ncbi:MAG: type II toxin-antitoxin system prevent-host-death family antitoxin [Deltaproteobacteria bacterium]|nr:type II toxin-antitoxin system prevent-host-death family antitoxin [Deltaproteobacteria bacterium]